MGRRLTGRNAARPIGLVMSLAVVCLNGCQGGSGPPPAQPGPYEMGAQAAPAKGTTAVANAAAAGKSAASDAAVPLDAKYTIVCNAFAGGDHVQRSKAWKDTLVRATNRSEFYVVHEEAASTLYFGYYREIEHATDPKEAKRADADLAFVRGLADGENHLLFPGALKEPLPVPDPDGPPEFDLTKLDADKSPDDPSRRYWSIAIGAYTADGKFDGADAHKSRKELAIESVIECRKHGIEAYYYNGPNVSTVCVGAWPRTALVEQEAKEASSSQDDGQELFVSNSPLPTSLTDQIAKSGRNVKVFQPKVEVDETSTLKDTWKNFPEYAVNGAVKVKRITDPKTGTVTEKRQSSFLFEIPRPQPVGLPVAEETTPAAAADLVNPLIPGSSTGRLKSVTP